ncbi:MAG TPA: DUF2231 domain-containing protein [Sphingomicrobium sp.]|nr:DUF2231 domain-containing protein [Sphingomicrobium sp.]
MAVLLVSLSAPATAHEEHKKKPVAAQVIQPGVRPGEQVAMQGGPTAMHAQMGEMMEEKEDRSQMSLGERLLDWLGRLHPVIVHFPIAFFPAALFTAVIGRRRPAFAAPVQFLVIAGGIIGPIAALLGWFDGGFDFTTDDMLLQWHRWLGTVIGVGALGLGIWAWHRPEANRGTAMIVGLTLITAAIVVQGWFGGAMVHGIDHMNW